MLLSWKAEISQSRCKLLWLSVPSPQGSENITGSATAILLQQRKIVTARRHGLLSRFFFPNWNNPLKLRNETHSKVSFTQAVPETCKSLHTSPRSTNDCWGEYTFPQASGWEVPGIQLCSHWSAAFSDATAFVSSMSINIPDSTIRNSNNKPTGSLNWVSGMASLLCLRQINVSSCLHSKKKSHRTAWGLLMNS